MACEFRISRHKLYEQAWSTSFGLSEQAIDPLTPTHVNIPKRVVDL